MISSFNFANVVSRLAAKNEVYKTLEALTPPSNNWRVNTNKRSLPEKLSTPTNRQHLHCRPPGAALTRTSLISQATPCASKELSQSSSDHSVRKRTPPSRQDCAGSAKQVKSRKETGVFLLSSVEQPTTKKYVCTAPIPRCGEPHGSFCS